MSSAASFLAKATSKFTVLHRVLSWIYRTFVLPFSSGYAKRMLWYTLRVKGKEIKALREQGFRGLHPYETHSWRWGMGKDNAFRRYYRGELDGERVFVKVAVNDSTVKNEVKLAEYLRPFNYPFLIKTVKTDYAFMGNMQMMSILFVDGLHRLTAPETEDTFEGYCREFSDILKAFGEIGIIHADIHPGNLMLGGDGRLIVLDFGISSIVGQENDVDYIARCGTHYREENGIRIYDDAYSFVKMTEKMNLPQNWLDTEAFQNIKEQIGMNVIRVNLSNGHVIMD